MKCCGINSHYDWALAEQNEGFRQQGMFFVPRSCCIDPESDECVQMYYTGIAVQNGTTVVRSELHSEVIKSIFIN